MKIIRFLKFIPILVYAYAWYYSNSQIDYMGSATAPEWTDPVLLITFLLSVIAVIWHIISSILGKQTGTSTAIYSIILKLLPIYPCLNMAIYALGALIVPIFGLMGSALIIFYLTTIMALTGTVQIGCIICQVREKKLPIPIAIICGILSYTIIADIIVAIFLLINSRKRVNHHPAQDQNSNRFF